MAVIIIGLSGSAGADGITNDGLGAAENNWVEIVFDQDCNYHSIDTQNGPAWLRRDSDSGQFYVNLAELRRHDQGRFLLADVNDQAVLEFIMDNLAEDPNEPGERLLSGGGGSAGSTNSMFASNGDAGFNGAHSLMSGSAQPVVQYGSTRGDALFAAPAEPVDLPTTIDPNPYTPGDTTPVPEPATICLLGFGGAALLRKRKK